MLLAIVKSLTGRTQNADEPVEEQSDEELMLAYANGDASAFEELVNRHERGLFNFILRSCGRRDLAEELLQEVFLRIIKSAARYEQTAKFTTWAYTIARNICIDRARKHGKYYEMSLNNPIGDDDGATFQDNLVDEHGNAASVDYDRKVFRKRLEAALQKLPEDQREVFMMREFSGLKFREIAEILECPVPTVKSRMRYALQDLRGHLAAYKGHSFDEEEERVTSSAEG